MVEKILDCTGLPCPQPVLKCKQTVDANRPSHIRVTVDNGAAAENVARFLGSQGYTTETEKVDTLFHITGVDKTEKCTACEVMTASAIAEVTKDSPALSSSAKNGTVVFITADTLGRGSEELGGKLMQNFLQTLPELGSSLWRIVLVNSAVHLCVEGNAGLEPLQKLLANGVSLLVCGTCLEYYDLLANKQVGETTNMLDVVTSLDLADKIIQI